MKRIKIYLLMLLAALTVGSCGSDNDGPGARGGARHGVGGPVHGLHAPQHAEHR